MKPQHGAERRVKLKQKMRRLEPGALVFLMCWYFNQIFGSKNTIQSAIKFMYKFSLSENKRLDTKTELLYLAY
jgi:hypothetical protein